MEELNKNKLFRIHLELTLEAESFDDARRRFSEWIAELSATAANGQDNLPKGFVAIEQEECVEII